MCNKVLDIVIQKYVNLYDAMPCYSFRENIIFILQIVLFFTNTYFVKVLGTPISGQGGSLWTLTQKAYFPKEFFDQTRYIIKTTLKH